MKPDQTTEQAFQKGAESLNDPDCNISINSIGLIYNHCTPSPANIQDATNAIFQLEFADIWRLPPFGITVGTVRLVVQESIEGGGRNWQILINGINGANTISAVKVFGNLAPASSQERQAYVQKMVRLALVESMNLAALREVFGPCN
ncbi:MAG TPA: hypothetical protein VGE90_14670 [Chitinophaga sp.]